jgi:hypothetical protein
MAIPIALEKLGWVVPPLRAQELDMRGWQASTWLRVAQR